MIRFILDTDTVSLFQHHHPQVVTAVQEHAPAELAITVLTVEKQLSGWYRELRKANTPSRLAAVYERLARTVQFLGRLNILPFPESAIQRYKALERLKLHVGKSDLRIAALALEQKAITVTCNLADFGRVPGLEVEDWTKSSGSEVDVEGFRIDFTPDQGNGLESKIVGNGIVCRAGNLPAYFAELAGCGSTHCTTTR